MPKPDGSPSAVVVSGGKQYRVAPGDRVLVDRLAAETGSEVKLGKVLLFTDGKEVKVGKDVGELDVDARVVGHPRGPRIESIRYKSKKRVRVHRGGRTHLTALEIIAVGGVRLETEEKTESKPKPKSATRGRAQAAPKANIEEPTDEPEAPKKAPRRRTEEETE